MGQRSKILHLQGTGFPGKRKQCRSFIISQGNCHVRKDLKKLMKGFLLFMSLTGHKKGLKVVEGYGQFLARNAPSS